VSDQFVQNSAIPTKALCIIVLITPPFSTCYVPVAQQSCSGLSTPNVEVCIEKTIRHTHTKTHKHANTRKDPSEQVIRPSYGPLPTKHTNNPHKISMHSGDVNPQFQQANGCR